MKNLFILQNDGKELERFAIECFHAVGQFGVEVQAVALVQYQVFAVDADEHAAFEHEVEFLSGMAVVVQRLVVGLGFYGYDEGVGRAVHESGSQ